MVNFLSLFSLFLMEQFQILSKSKKFGYYLLLSIKKGYLILKNISAENWK